MAKVTGPLGHMSASGMLAHAITYRHTKNGHIAQAYQPSIPANSPKQRTQQRRFTEAVILADSLLTDPECKEYWQEYVIELGLPMDYRNALIQHIMRTS